MDVFLQMCLLLFLSERGLWVREKICYWFSRWEILFRSNTITDSKFKTKGSLNGAIEHNNFADWN
jgi:hypothetical protein